MYQAKWWSLRQQKQERIKNKIHKNMKEEHGIPQE